jgi:ATP-dependent helicase/DNAse subunit B
MITFITLTGKVTDRSGEALGFSNVYLSDASGEVAKDQSGKTYSVLTNIDGTYSISIPAFMQAGVTVPVVNHVSAKYTGYQKETIKIGSSRKYDFVLSSGGSQNVPEVTVTHTREDNTEDDPKKKLKLWHWLLIGGGALILIGTIVGVATKKRK